MQTCMINIDHLVKRYGNKYAVNDISFKVGEGEIVGFSANGAGKSTTMNILTGYLSYTSGTVEVGGLDIIDHAFEVKMIGYLPEQPPLYSDMTVEDYLNFVYDLKSALSTAKAHHGDKRGRAHRRRLQAFDRKPVQRLPSARRHRAGSCRKSQDTRARQAYHRS